MTQFEFDPGSPTGPEVYLASGYEFHPLLWNDQMTIPPGSVVRLSHILSEYVTIFEATDIHGTNRAAAEGFMSQFMDGKLIEGRKPAIINTVYPASGLLEFHIPYVEFLMGDINPTSKLRSIRHVVTFTSAEVYFDQTLASAVFEQAKRRQELAPFLSETAHSTLSNAVTFLLNKATATSDPKEAETYRQCAEVISRELIL